ncbi:MAG: RNA 2',3'-cyclic phosphodiesterase [Spirochaetes bacterium]|nr:RNA 2',3'-cyclic phosphodiesterase [Spirochaetota bacterium]
MNNAGGETLRLFISLPLQPEVKKALLEVQKRLPSTFFKPLPRENFHLTLAFLGDTHVGNLPALEQIMEETADCTAPFPCVLSGLGAFPSPWEPRVVWVGIDVGSRESEVLSNTLRGHLRQAKVSFDTKPFRPHITIAYARKNLSRLELREAGEEFSLLLREIGEAKQTEKNDSAPHQFDGGRGNAPQASRFPVKQPFGFPRLQFFIEEVALVKSELRPEGAIHTPIHIARFRDG